MADFTSRWIACESEARKNAYSIFFIVFQCFSLISYMLHLIQSLNFTSNHTSKGICSYFQYQSVNSI